MPGITCGAKLVKALADSGTPAGPDGPLAAARSHLKLTHAGEDRVATAAEIVRVLADELGDDHGTVVKARNLLATGEAHPPVSGDRRPIEEQLLGPPPAEVSPVATGAPVAPAEPSVEVKPVVKPAVVQKAVIGVKPTA